MAGVAGPMLRRTAGAGMRFLTGLTVGGVAAGLILAAPAYLLASAVEAAIPMQARLWLLSGVCALLAIADLANRTPHVSRQVPQPLIHRLQPGPLGVAWGFDLGLLFTTQKVVSLIWVALAAVVLLDPVVAAVAPVGIAVLASFAIATSTVRGTTRAEPTFRWERQWQTRTRRASGLTLLVLFVLTASQAWQT
ncbi:MAG: hypothetical protein GEV03_15960 [Streptosporangiales bacterium]|nr:hypothetical protein [Streptosporangiales bacterium]